jgi:hypothetical protein
VLRVSVACQPARLHCFADSNNSMFPYSLKSSKIAKQKSPDTFATTDPHLTTSPTPFTHLPESPPIDSQAESNT